MLQVTGSFHSTATATGILLYYDGLRCVMLISSELAQPLMMFAGLGIICWLLLRGRATRSLRMAKGNSSGLELKHNGNAQARPLPFSGVSSLGAPTEVLKWQVELHDLGRELKAELDSKLVAVRAMAQAYDEASTRLVKLLRATEGLGAKAEGTRAEHHDPEHIVQRAKRLAAQGHALPEIARIIEIDEADVAAFLSDTYS